VLNLTANSLKVFLALDPCDMRKSFNGLQQLATDQLGNAPSRDALFVFTNKARNRLKLLYFDGTGLWVAAKRLERGRFSWPSPSEPGQRRIKLHAEALQLLIDGVDLRGAAFRPWYERAE
jgi:transposase